MKPRSNVSTFRVGSRIYDADYGQYGTVTEIDRYAEGCEVLQVTWDGGGTSDFEPNCQTRVVAVIWRPAG